MLGNAGKNRRRPKNKQVQQKTINVFLALLDLYEQQRQKHVAKI